MDFAKTNEKFEIVGGAMGDTVLDVNGVKALASLPSLDELRAKIVGLLQAPATKIASSDSARGQAGPGRRGLCRQGKRPDLSQTSNLVRTKRLRKLING